MTAIGPADQRVSHADAVRAVYRQLLERDPDPAGAAYWLGVLDRGDTVRLLVRQIGKSPEYKQRFVNAVNTDDAVTMLYRKFLAREPDANGKSSWIAVLSASGWDTVVDGAVDSAEYVSRFGEFIVPGQQVRIVSDISSVRAPGTDIHVDRYTAVARGRHGQWVRASATLKSDGNLQAQLGLETDSILFGIAGTVTVRVKDRNGGLLWSGDTEQCTLAGKTPGPAVRGDWTSKVQTLPTTSVDLAASVEAIPNVKEDNMPRPFGISDWKLQIDFLNIKT